MVLTIKSTLVVLWDGLTHKALSCVFSHQVLLAQLGGSVAGDSLSACDGPSLEGVSDAHFGHFTAKSLRAFKVNMSISLLSFTAMKIKAQRSKVIALHELV